MAIYNVRKQFEHHGFISEKASAVMRMFGLTADRLSETAVEHKCELEIQTGQIVYITGPSGAGKSVLLRELEKSVPQDQRINLAQIKLAHDKSLVDCFEGGFLDSLKLLSAAGLNDVFSVLNSPANLSEGQRYRFQLAVALAQKKRFIFADEFCSNLDRITAAVIAYNIRKFADRNAVSFVLASSHADIMADLVPDVLVNKELSGPARVVYKTKRKKARV